jgi:hypothetical protein
MKCILFMLTTFYLLKLNNAKIDEAVLTNRTENIGRCKAQTMATIEPKFPIKNATFNFSKCNIKI